MKYCLLLTCLFLTTFVKAQVPFCIAREIPNRYNERMASISAPAAPYIGKYAPAIGIGYITDYSFYKAHNSDSAYCSQYIDSTFAINYLINKKDSMLYYLASKTIFTHPDGFYSNLDSLTFGVARNSLVAKGDFFHLITDINAYAGGISWIAGLCYPPYNCCMSGVNGFIPLTNWDSVVTNHEGGHAAGGGFHTHGSWWNGDSTKIDDCGGVMGYPECNYWGVNCSILPVPMFPVGGGTILSYCHLIDSVGINVLQNRFGKQVSDSMRSYMNYYRNCLVNPDYYGYIPLPISMVSFTGTNQRGKTILKWTTHFESNSWRFIVKRNGEIIGYVEAIHFADNNTYYDFTDYNINKGEYIYSLEEEDYNGTITDCGKVAIFNEGMILNKFLSLGIYDIIGRQIKN